MSGAIRLENLIEKVHVKRREFDSDDDLEAFGVSNTEGITRTAHRKSEDLGEYLVIEPGSFAYNPYRINVGSIGLTPTNVTGVVSPAYVVFRVKERELIPEVLLDFLKSSEGLRQINKLARGAVRKALRFEDLCEIEFPAIPYERQLEILKYKHGFNKQHGSLLSGITHQQSLLAKLKQAILQEAIQGKLTTDWRAAHPDVEPASQLLQRIHAEKARLIAAKPKRPDKPLPKIPLAETPFEIPMGWEWCRIGEVCKISSGKGFAKNEYSKSGVRLFQIANVSIGETSWESTVHIPESYSAVYPDLLLNEGDLVMALNRPLLGRKLKVAILTDADVPAVLYQRVGRFDMIERAIIPWLFIYLTSDCFSGWLYDQIKGVNIPFVNQSKVHTHLFPIPPLDEQVAIVERVNQLMQYCEQLEDEIDSSKKNADSLMKAVLKEAFSNSNA